jgi:DMSO reductase anchor subunit
VSVALLFLFPILATLLLFAPLPRLAHLALAILSTVSVGLGVVIERWLFFAQAEHVVVIYYRGGAA